jgi:uncharacterized protein (DUF983 family)
MLARGVVRRCPRCGARHVFERWFSIRERCPRCGVRFDRKPEEAFFLGAFVIQTAMILTPLAVLLFLYGMAVGDVIGGSPKLYVVLMVLVAAVLPLVTYPSTKTTWFAIDLAMEPLSDDEQAEASAAASPTPG